MTRHTLPAVVLLALCASPIFAGDKADKKDARANKTVEKLLARAFKKGVGDKDGKTIFTLSDKKAVALADALRKIALRAGSRVLKGEAEILAGGVKRKVCWALGRSGQRGALDGADASCTAPEGCIAVAVGGHGGRPGGKGGAAEAKGGLLSFAFAGDGGEGYQQTNGGMGGMASAETSTKDNSGYSLMRPGAGGKGKAGAGGGGGGGATMGGPGRQVKGD